MARPRHPPHRPGRALDFLLSAATALG
jgi:hypothetical protein